MDISLMRDVADDDKPLLASYIATDLASAGAVASVGAGYSSDVPPLAPAVLDSEHLVSKNDEICIKNEEMCIKHDEFCSSSRSRQQPPRCPTLRSTRASRGEFCI